jgi:CRISPR-associated endonuclease/helicase Cas3
MAERWEEGAATGVVEDGRFGGIDLCPWAKFAKLDVATWAVYGLLFHMLDVAAIAFELWDVFLTRSQRSLVAEGLGVAEWEARAVAAFMAGLHDLGKLIPYFQSCEPVAWARLGDDLVADAGRVVAMAHERASMHTALGLLGELGFDVAGNDSVGTRAAQVLSGSHGRYLQLDMDQAASAARVAATLGGSRWRDLRRRYVGLVRHLTGAQKVPARTTVPAAVLITGLSMVADRLASRRGFWLANAHVPAFGASEHFAQARGRARDEVARSGLARFELARVPFSRAYGDVVEPNGAQAALVKELPRIVTRGGPGILVVTDATGAGKTVMALEASRIFTEHCGTQGLMWLLPTTATADAAHRILQEYVCTHQSGRALVTLVHHTWLNAAYSDDSLASEEDHAPEGPAGRRAEASEANIGTTTSGHGSNDPREADGRAAEGESESIRSEGLLRSHEEALLAQFTVATIDQALMAVLPVRNNMLRLLALSGKTVVIDEAHALEPFSHLQLRRLLNWLGALGVPVVLLSATMPASTSDDMVRAYLLGAGRKPRELAGRSFAPDYPGWLYTDAAAGTPHRMDEPARRAYVAAQQRILRVRTREVRHVPLGESGRKLEDGERLAVIGEVVGRVIREGGCAAVACETVPDAQDTYRYLRRSWIGPARDLVLLHARLPGYVREAVTRRLLTELGPSGPRPDRLVVVTTSLLDMSLNVDVDLMVSDLASLARILHRAGRLARFRHLWKDAHRPDWWSGEDPVLTVLRPVNARGGTSIPRGWRTVEPAYLLHATADLLSDPEDRLLQIPQDVQGLVEQVHGAGSVFAAETAGLEHLLAGHLARINWQEHLGAVHLVPPPSRVSSLADLHRQYLTTAQAATRLTTLPCLLLPCYRTAGGLSLDRAGRQPLPDQPNLTNPQLRQVLQSTLPVPAAWVADRAAASPHLPASWQQHPILAGLVPLPADPVHPEQFHHFGRHKLRMDDELGLIHE